jgi:hypothetical protein
MPGVMTPMVMLIMGLGGPTLASTVMCTSWEDRELKRIVTTCTDGARAITRYDEDLKRWTTEIITPAQGEKPPTGVTIPDTPLW